MALPVFLNARHLASALGGEARGDRVSAPGPGHSRRDRSLSIRVDPQAPDGFVVTSFAGDDWAAAKDHVRAAAGLPAYSGERRELTAEEKAEWARQRAAAERLEETRQATLRRLALATWAASQSIVGTPAETYLQGRLAGATLPTGTLAADALRFHPRCRFGDHEAPAMVALFRNVVTGEPQSIHRTALKPDGSGKAVLPDGGQAKRMLGTAKGAAIMLSPSDDVTTGLGIAEGIETALTLIACAGWRPVWAVGSSSNVTEFPVLAGVDELTIFADHDEAGQRAAEACADRWQSARRAWSILTPRPIGADWNDVPRAA